MAVTVNGGMRAPETPIEATAFFQPSWIEGKSVKPRLNRKLVAEKMRAVFAPFVTVRIEPNGSQN